MEVHGIGLVEKLFDIACTLTDVMSCVPYEQHTFEYGPRDYLNQLMSLISTLRGGQQRYLPLLMSKISETMPSMPMPGYSLPMVPGGGNNNNTRLEELYDSQSQVQSHSSSASTPFGSPPLSAAGGPSGMMGFHDGFQMAGPPAPTTTAGLGYGDLTSTTAPLQMYHDPVMHGYPTSNPGPKYEGHG